MRVVKSILVLVAYSCISQVPCRPLWRQYFTCEGCSGASCSTPVVVPPSLSALWQSRLTSHLLFQKKRSVHVWNVVSKHSELFLSNLCFSTSSTSNSAVVLGICGRQSWLNAGEFPDLANGCWNLRCSSIHHSAFCFSTSLVCHKNV